MRNSIIKILFVSVTLICQGQVGINTQTPNATLEIEASNSANPSNVDGILIPRVDKFPDTNPAAVSDSILLYLTTADGNNLPGYYFWNQSNSRWCRLLTNVNMILATETGSSLNLLGSIFNFPSMLYNDIPGASMNSSHQLQLPVGVYEVESSFKSSTGVFIEWNMRLNGTVYAGSIPGNSSVISVLGIGISTSTPQRAIVVVNDDTDYIDFQITAGLGLGINLVPNSCYLKIKKVG